MNGESRKICGSSSGRTSISAGARTAELTAAAPSGHMTGASQGRCGPLPSMNACKASGLSVASSCLAAAAAWLFSMLCTTHQVVCQTCEAYPGRVRDSPMSVFVRLLLSSLCSLCTGGSRTRGSMRSGRQSARSVRLRWPASPSTSR